MLWFFTGVEVANFPAAQTIGSQNQDQQTIVLPLELVAGQPATLAVLGPSGRIASGVKVVLSSGDVLTTDESGRAHFLQPFDAGVMFARIEGTAVREAADVLPQEAASTVLQVARMPRFVALENHFSLSGTGFQGDADQNRVKVGDKRILILASSPLQLIAMAPAKSVPGPVSIVVAAGTTEVAAKVTFIGVTTAATNGASIRRGKKSSIVMRALGTTDPVDLLIRNLSPDVVQFPHGNEQRVRTAGGEDNSGVLELKGVGTGPFSYGVTLEDSSMEINPSVARDFLEAAAKIAQPDAASRVALVLRELRGDKIDAVKVRNELDAISSQGGSEDFQALIRAARKALSGE